jgi:hypothetical protein
LAGFSHQRLGTNKRERKKKKKKKKRQRKAKRRVKGERYY